MVERFETSSGLQAHRGSIKYNFKKHTKMEKKFILQSQLEDVVGHLMERVIANCDKVSIDFSISKVYKDLILDVTVREAKTYEGIEKVKYTIVPNLEDEINVEDDTIGLALAKAEGRYQAAKEMVETNTPKEN